LTQHIERGSKVGGRIPSANRAFPTKLVFDFRGKQTCPTKKKGRRNSFTEKKTLTTTAGSSSKERKRERQDTPKDVLRPWEAGRKKSQVGTGGGGKADKQRIVEEAGAVTTPGLRRSVLKYSYNYRRR